MAPPEGWAWKPGLFLLLANLTFGHNWYSDKEHVAMMRKFTQKPGVVASFRTPLSSGDHYLGYHGWKDTNRQYQVSNISIIVRLEFDRFRYRHNRIKKTYKRFFIPGTHWIGISERGQHYYNKNFHFTRSKNSSALDLWVEPVCFLKNNGISRIYRITRSLKMHIYNLRWLAKLNFKDEVDYEFRELRQFGKFLTQLPGIDCAWVHPATKEKYSLLVKFDKDRVPAKRFFHPLGFHAWDKLNNQYQVTSISYLVGWNRALLHFQSGLHCKESSRAMAVKYRSIPGIFSVFRDEYQNCRLTYRILIKFDGRYMTPKSIHHYQDWSSLNYMYGVVNISYHDDAQLVAHLEFEPGLYNNHLMKAIRSEYLKLKGIMFAWVEGRPPGAKTRITVKFQSHLNLLNYTHWSRLNTLYFTQVRRINHNSHEALLEIPEGRYSESDLLKIHSEYRNLPGVLAVEAKDMRAMGGSTVSLRGAKQELLTLGNTWWVPVQDGDEEDEDEINNEMIKNPQLYHKYRNKTENSLWENHCDLH